MASLQQPDLPAAPKNGWILYDGECALCTGLAGKFGPALRRRGFELAPLQASWVAPRLGLQPGVVPDEMKLLTAAGAVYGGHLAFAQIFRRIWWAWPGYAASRLPGMDPVFRRGYRWLADHRHLLLTGSAQSSAAPAFGLIPLALLPALIIWFRPLLLPWAFMLLLATAIFAGCKWLTYWRARESFKAVSHWRAIGFLLAWPGMDAAPFTDAARASQATPAREWLAAFIKTASGALLIWCIARRLDSHDSLIAGWCGFFGGLLIFHFGLFHLLSLAWRMAGIAARPIMRSPFLAASLADFWGSRWNTAFHELAHTLLFNPIKRLFGARSALLMTFFASGGIHELVISVPARGGYGLPTLYFLLQGIAVILERSVPGKALGLGTGVIGWLYSTITVLAPAPLLFHPLFMKIVIHPLLQAIHAV
jgi:alginate O-acetyltransferase complex protein AlgI